MTGQDAKRVAEESVIDFPSGYAYLTAAPLLPVVVVFASAQFVPPRESMAFGYMCILSMMPIGLVVTAVGAIWILRGGARKYPDLRWLVWIPLGLGSIGWVAT